MNRGYQRHQAKALLRAEFTSAVADRIEELEQQLKEHEAVLPVLQGQEDSKDEGEGLGKAGNSNFPYLCKSKKTAERPRAINMKSIWELPVIERKYHMYSIMRIV